MMQRLTQLSMVAATSLTLAACLPRSASLDTPRQQQAEASGTPTIVIPAPGARVRSMIAARAQARGTTVASNTLQGVVLERALTQSPEALEAQCGPHQPGRMIRVVLTTRDSQGGTTVTEQRYIVDGSEVCTVVLSPDEVTQANASLQETRNQVLGTPAAQAPGPVAPATPRT